MMYRGYKIERERDHVKVTDPFGVEWREDTVEDAKASIDRDEDLYLDEDPDWYEAE